MMKVKPQSKEPVRPLRSGSKIQNMKLPGPPPEKMPKMASEIEDLSILKKSVDTNVTNPIEILKIFQGGTPEVIETLKNECSMIYECKVCRNLFRSVANFITHKRNYCTTKFTVTQNSSKDSEMLEHSLIIGTEKGTVTSSRKTTRRDILSLLDNFKERKPDSKQGLIFTEIPQSNAAVFNSTQSTATIFKDERVRNNETVVVGPSGHVVGSTQDNGLTTQCKSCGEGIQDMERHLSTCNSVFKQCFGCPLCEKYFTTAWAVYRHLRKLHGKNTEQVRRLRSLITKQELPVEQKLKRQSIVIPTQNSNHSEKGWLEELEKNGTTGLYKCYICSKQFERRAVLLSHMQVCEKKKPITIAEPKKPVSFPSLGHEKQLPPATIQVRVCYKKEEIVQKLADCRVVATRLSDDDTLLGPTRSDDNTLTDDVMHRSGKANAVLDREDYGKRDKVNEVETHNNGNKDGYDENEIFEEETNDLNEEQECNSKEIQNDLEHEVQHNLPQDIFSSQQLLETSQEIEETAPCMSKSELDLPTNPVLTNGFLSSPANSSKAPTSPIINSVEKLVNGWALSENETEKDSLYCAFIESNSNENDESDRSCDTTPEEELDECEIDSLAITRIICGSVKTDVRESDDEATEEKFIENDDTQTVSSEKHTPSVSTEMSFEFEVEHELEITSDNEYDDIDFPIDLYISRTDSICLICNSKLMNKEASCHIANHLGLNRFSCAIPSCSMRSYFRSDMIEHIKTFHKIEFAASLVKTIKTNEIIMEDSTSEFLGFETSDNLLSEIHYKFYDELNNSFGIDSLDE